MALTAGEAAVIEARSHEPFAVLGQHEVEGGWEIRAFLPDAQAAWVVSQDKAEAMDRVDDRGFFVRRSDRAHSVPYKLAWQKDGVRSEAYDAYCFGPGLTDFELHLFNEGHLLHAHLMLGAHGVVVDGVAGVRFATWAPNAQRVSVVGDFNAWDGRRHAMRSHGTSGVWEIFVPDVAPGARYKFEIRNRTSGSVLVKVDPYAQAFEKLPGNASLVAGASTYQWSDRAWLDARAHWDWQHRPFNCYEVHLGSWRRDPSGEPLSYLQTAEQLIPYLRDMGYTHVELLPVSEYPLDESWGYQTTGYFAPTSRYGSPDDFRAFIDRMHQAGIGVVLDWVPAHFPRDDWALARFDGTPLYEHEDPQRGEHPDWGTFIPNYGRAEVRSFLLSSALHWLEEFHCDGLRVDAVASMLYLDYSRKPQEWQPNRHGGRENLEAVEFLKEMNATVHQDCPGVLTIAEESTAWPMVSRPTYAGGLGFSMKWSMGWMNDTLRYMQLDPIHRRFHQEALTFSQLYAYTENFVLPLSHDEVVHEKRSLLDKMPGDAWHKFAGLRLLLAYQMAYPGKKLMFMGNEFGQGIEWNERTQLSWELLETDSHRGVQATARDLNRLYAELPALHRYDFEQRGFEWIDCEDAEASTISFLRRSDDTFVVCAFNFTPIARHGYRIGVPAGGDYREIFNSDAARYGGSGIGNAGLLRADAVPCMGRSHSLSLTLPPMAGLILAPAS